MIKPHIQCTQLSVYLLVSTCGIHADIYVCSIRVFFSSVSLYLVSNPVVQHADDGGSLTI